MNDLVLNNNLTMTSLEISELLGSRHDNVKRTIETLAGKGVIELPQTEDIKTSTKPMGVFVFSGEKGKRDSIIVVAQLSPEFTAVLVDRWQELERGAIKLPSNYLEALEALVSSEKEKIAITHERDEAIRTKAQIGSKREASAMAKASAESKKVKALEIKLDESSTYSTILRMNILHNTSFKHHKLVKRSKEMNLPPKRVDSEQFGFVNSYHKDVWMDVFGLEIKK